MTTKQLNVRLPSSSHALLAELQERLGMTQVQVLVVALEYLALVKGVEQLPAAAAITPQSGDSHE
jgi:hypothetical protein